MAAHQITSEAQSWYPSDHCQSWITLRVQVGDKPYLDVTKHRYQLLRQRLEGFVVSISHHKVSDFTMVRLVYIAGRSKVSACIGWLRCCKGCCQVLTVGWFFIL